MGTISKHRWIICEANFGVVLEGRLEVVYAIGRKIKTDGMIKCTELFDERFSDIANTNHTDSDGPVKWSCTEDGGSPSLVSEVELFEVTMLY